VDYLDAAARLAAGGKALSYRRMRLTPGDTVLDVGCGPGTDTLALAARVAPGGRVWGVDHDPAMVAEAERRATAAGLARNLTHRVADAAQLPFADAEFDAVRSERLLQHLAHPAAAAAEMVRVTRPGGRVVLMDTDWGTRSVDTPEVELERRLARVLSERCLRNGYSGRRLYGLLRGAGIRAVRVDLVPLHVGSYDFWRMLSRMEMACAEAVRAGELDEEEVRRLDDSFRTLDEEGNFFATTTVVLVSGSVGE
jgi:SAM-dependent methyltransferase